MTRHETLFVIDRDLIIVDAVVVGPRGTASGRFVLDTGTTLTTMFSELADTIGYSARDGFRRTRVRTAVGDEEGYGVRVAAFTVLGFERFNFPVHVFDLGHDDIHGLLGMNFLSDYNFDIRPAEGRILVEKLAS